MKTILTVLVFGGTFFSLLPNASAVEWTTNGFITSAKGQWRILGGNIQDTASWNWNKREGVVLCVTNGVIFVERRWTEPVSQTITHSTGNNHGNLLGGGDPTYAERRIVGEKEVRVRFALTNYLRTVEVGWQVNDWSAHVGSIEFRGEALKLYDCGVAPTAADIEIEVQNLNRKAAEFARNKAERDAILTKKRIETDSRLLFWQFQQASNGFASAQCSLGLRYLKGQGIPTNEVLGRYWLEKSARQNNLEAQAALTKLTNVTSMPPQAK